VGAAASEPPPHAISAEAAAANNMCSEGFMRMAGEQVRSLQPQASAAATPGRYRAGVAKAAGAG